MYIGLGSYYPRRVMEEVDKKLEEAARGRETPKGKIFLVRKRKEYAYETIEDLIDVMKVVPFEP